MSSQVNNRFILIDNLRGLAAFLVAGFHFYNGSPLESPLSKVLPSPISEILKHGYLGVEFFFVISGFFTAYSLHKSSVTISFSTNFMLRRFIRLSPPYLLTITLVILTNLISNYIFTDRIAPLPNLASIAAHLFYLQGILGFDQISPVFWTLCIEVQFYLAFITLVSIFQYCSRYFDRGKTILTVGIFLLLNLASIASFVGWIDLSIPGLFIPYWYMFFTGVVIHWSLINKINILFWLHIILTSIPLLVSFKIELFVVIIVAIVIYLTLNQKYLQKRFSNSWLLFLGQISYSLYLVHLVVGMRFINVGYRISSHSSFMAIIWLLMAFSSSIIAALVMHLFIEAPCIKWSKKLKTKIIA